MSVATHGISGLSGGRVGGGRWYECRTKPGRVGHMLGDARALPEIEVIH